MVSKACRSQLSSPELPSAALMPAWAAPVPERVGCSLLSTAVRVLRARLQGGAQPGRAGAHDHDVVAVQLHEWEASRSR